MDYVTVSAKISKELRDKLREFGIKPGPVIREALEREVRGAMFRRIEEEAKRLSRRLPEIPDDEVVRVIREDREK